jgi:16S rRNA (uracil1498-N3)-methyltransferase
MSLVDFERRVNALTQMHVADVASPVLAKDDRHHLFKVLRANAGEEIVVTDGRGSWAFATVGDGDIVRTSDVVVDPEPAPTELYIVPLKGDKSELAVSKLVELGVTTIRPLISDNMQVKFKGEHRDKILERWQRIAREAAGQCRRTYDITITDPVKISDVPVDVAVAEPGTTGSLRGIRAIAIGPEGGWAEGEWSEKQLRIGLGTTVLRGETAAIVAATLLVLRGEGWAVTSYEGAVRNNGFIQ